MVDILAFWRWKKDVLQLYIFIRILEIISEK